MPLVVSFAFKCTLLEMSNASRLHCVIDQRPVLVTSFYRISTRGNSLGFTDMKLECNAETGFLPRRAS